MRATREQRVMFSALAGGATLREALISASECALTPSTRAAWRALANDPDPAAALQRSRLVPELLALFVQPTTATSLATRGELVSRAMRPTLFKSFAPFMAINLVAGSALVGLGAQQVLARFVQPALAVFAPGSPDYGAAAALAFVFAGALGLVPLVRWLAPVFGWIGARPTGDEAIVSLSGFGEAPSRACEEQALLWLFVSEGAGVAPREVMERLARCIKARKMRRFADLASPGMSAPQVVKRWAAEGVLSPPIATALEGAFELREPLLRLSRLSRSSRRDRGVGVERGLMTVGTAAVAIGALLLCATVYGAIFKLGMNL